MNIRGRWLILFLALTVCLSTSATMAGGDANLFIGWKSIDDDAFESTGVDDQPEFGVAVSLDFEWPVVLAIDLLSSSDDSTRTIPATFPVQQTTDVDTLELDIGVRKFWKKGRARPYIGGGLAFIQLDAKQTTLTTILGNTVADTLIDDDDTGIGVWVNGGVLWTFDKGFNIGVDARFSDADGDLSAKGFSSEQEFSSGGFHLGLMLGYNW